MDTKISKLVLITNHYPYGKGETFLEDELKTVAVNFSEILIVSCDRVKNYSERYVPNNATVLSARKKRIEFWPLLKALMSMFSLGTWKEKFFACRSLGYCTQRIAVNKKVIIFFYIKNVIEKTVSKLNIPDDAVLYSYWMAEGAFFLSEYKKKHPNVTCVCRTHGGDCYIDKFYQPFRREILSSMDAIFPISEAGKSSIENLIVPHVENRCAPLIVERLGINKLSTKMNPSKISDEFSIITCSNVIPLKRLDLLIDALSMIDGEKINWIHFGDGELMNDIQVMAKERLTVNSIHYEFKGYCPKADIIKWYEDHHVDLFINCSDSEGIPVSIMEAFSYGIPAVARNVGGNGEIVETDKNGILLDEKCSPEQLAETIVTFMNKNEDDINKMRSNAFETFNSKYNAEKNYKDFYSQLEMLKNKKK